MGVPISVGLPVYNGEKTLREAIESILNQTLSDFHLIISDNASSDGTEAICRDFAARDDRVRYHRNPVNIGVFRNFDAVFKGSDSRYFRWASANDLCEPTLLEECLAVLEAEKDVVLVYPRTKVLWNDETSAQPYDDDLDLRENRPSDRFRHYVERVGLNNVMYGLIRSTVLRRTALNRAYLGSDYSLLAELSLHGKFVQIPKYLFCRRMGPSHASAMKSGKDLQRMFADEPENVERLATWRRYAGFLSAVRRAPIPLGEKLEVYASIARYARWDRNTLARECWSAMTGHEAPHQSIVPRRSKAVELPEKSLVTAGEKK